MCVRGRWSEQRRGEGGGQVSHVLSTAMLMSTDGVDQALTPPPCWLFNVIGWDFVLHPEHPDDSVPHDLSSPDTRHLGEGGTRGISPAAALGAGPVSDDIISSFPASPLSVAKG